MKSIKIHGAMDLRIDDYPLENISSNQVEISIATGGICGTDLHYYKHGGFGHIKLKEPMVLGHEVSGHVTKLGPKVTNLSIGQLVSVSPSRPCNKCIFCLEGNQNHCINMQFYGSAMPFPHIQGAFRERLITEDYQCVAADGAGAEKILVTDISDKALVLSNLVGADKVINTSKNYPQIEKFQVGKGYFDLAIECSGSASGINDAIKCLKPKGTLIQLGLGGDILMPLVSVTTKELNIKGSFRFHSEFELAVKMMKKKLIDVKPLITHSIPFQNAEQGFKIAMDEKENSMKVQLIF